MNEILSSEEVAEMLGCTIAVVEANARKGIYPGIKPGRSWRFPREALMEQLNHLARTNVPQVILRGKTSTAPTFENWVPSPQFEGKRSK